MDLKEAYETLGLTEDAPMEEVEKTYEMHLRRSRRGSDQDQLSRINEAYRFIKNEAYKRAIEASQEGKKPWQEKLEHIWYYYKWHIIGGFLFIFFAASIALAVINHVQEQKELANLPPPSVEIMIYGDFFSPNTERLEQQLLNAQKEWQRVRTVFSYFPLDARDPYALAAQQRSLLDLVSETPDLFLADEDNFMRLHKQGAFQPLDGWEQDISAWFEKDQLIYLRDEENGEERLYGIEVATTGVLDGVFFEVESVICGISIHAANLNEAIEALRVISSENN